MAALSVSENCLALSCGNKTCVIFDAGGTKCLEAPLTEKITAAELEECKSENVIVDDHSVSNEVGLCLVSSDISPCGKWLVFCSSSKYLSFWDLCDCKLISNRHLIRGASQVKFTPSISFIIVADKSGDVYQFSTLDSLAPGTLILGHLSMLLDVLISSNEQFIITCDRDEKIRVSCFPNAYNIKSYCLGHEEFITSICFLSHNEDILVSASGDGTVRLWDYCLGSQIAEVECYKEIENSTSIYAVTSLTTTLNNSSSSIVCATLNDYQGCLVYIVKEDDQKLTFNFIHTINLEIVPWSIKLTKKNILWLLSTSEKIDLHAKIWNKEMQRFIDTNDNSIDNTIKIINEQVFNNVNTSNILTLLYKRKFDNVQVYLERKQARLMIEPLNKKD